MAAARLRATFVARALRALVGTTLGITGAIVWTLSLVTTLPELARNDLRFVLVPSDLALGVLAGRRLYLYAVVRTLMALTVFVVDVAGGSLQPLAVPAVVVACAMLPWALKPEVSSSP
jgi:Ca2+/Na+ antiporter